MVTLPGLAQSCWVATSPETAYPALDGDLEADVAVIGAGIVGLTAALRLAQEGRSVIVLEALRVGRQVTGRSTAKITSQHGLVYRHLMDTLGEDKARLHAEANETGCATIRRWAADLAIDCDLEPKHAYVYALDPAHVAELKAEAEAARRLGLPADFVEEPPLPFPTRGAVRFRDQAQFNPAKYLAGLAAAVADRGGRVFEASRATAMERGDRWLIRTDGGTVTARDVVMATHQPFPETGNYDLRTQPRCHVALAVRVEADAVPDGMFIAAHDPIHSIRGGHDDRGPLVVVLGPRFPTGQEGDVGGKLLELEAWARRNFPVREVAYRWVNEDYDTCDRLPYVGMPEPDGMPGFHVATGFNAWGISNGAAAGLLIADRILGRDNAWAALYDPARPYDPAFHQGGDTRSKVRSAADIAAGSGGVIETGDGPVALWKDGRGRVHAFSAECTHKGCTVTWNNADGTWDCPCHGSIFAADGSVLHGPAVRPLERRDPA